MLCREAKMSISPYLDGQLDFQQAQVLEEHLATCDDCRARLEAYRVIPVALKTDRMLAPRTEFTHVVMQRIVVQKQMGNLAVQTRTESVTVITERGQQTAPKSDGKVVQFVDYQRKPRRAPRPSEYVLRFASVAAIFVVMVGVGIYVMASTGDTTMATAAVYNAITGLGDNLRNVLSSPSDLALGVVITGIVLIGLWYIIRILRSYNNSNSSQSK